MMQTITRRPTSDIWPNGFSLIELLITIAIIGIIAAVGFPSYTEYVKNTRRTDGQLALLNVTQAMERCKTTRFTYLGCTIPANLTTSPEDFYTLAFGEAVTATTFTVVATPTGLQSGDEACPSLSIDEAGERMPADCW